LAEAVSLFAVLRTAARLEGNGGACGVVAGDLGRPARNIRKPAFCLRKFGAPEEIRTPDPQIRSQWRCPKTTLILFSF